MYCGAGEKKQHKRQKQDPNKVLFFVKNKLFAANRTKNADDICKCAFFFVSLQRIDSWIIINHPKI